MRSKEPSMAPSISLSLSIFMWHVHGAWQMVLYRVGTPIPFPSPNFGQKRGAESRSLGCGLDR